MIRARLALVLAIVLALSPLDGFDLGRGDAPMVDDVSRFGAQIPGAQADDHVDLAATPEPQATPESGDGAGVIVPAEGTDDGAADEEVTGEIVPVDVMDDAASGGETPSRLRARVPGPLTLWIILPRETFTVGENDTCVGAGSFVDLQPGGVVSLLDEGAGVAHIESVMIEATGRIYFDTVLQQDICAFDLTFTSVVPGTSVLVDLDRVVLGRFDHTAPPSSAGEPAVYDIVIGE